MFLYSHKNNLFWNSTKIFCRFLIKSFLVEKFLQTAIKTHMKVKPIYSSLHSELKIGYIKQLNLYTIYNNKSL